MNPKEKLAGLAEEIGDELEMAGYGAVTLLPTESLRDWHSRLAAILATLPEPGVVTDEVARVAVNAYDRATGEGWQMPCVQGMRSALEAALPYLAPAARLGNKLGRDPQVPRHVYQRVDSHCGEVRMTRSTNMEHVEVLERLRGVLEHGKMGDKCLIAPDLVTAAIAALSAPQSGDWVLVPREPTPEMVCAGFLSKPDDNGFVVGEPMDAPSLVWRAMLAAAPQPPAEAQPVGGGEEGFKAWVVEQMPAGTVIDNPAWWADRLARAYAVNVPAPPSAPVGVEGESVRVGNLPTMNQDGYPGLGEWWVQLWRGDEIIARVYGDGPDEVRSQAQDIADALNQQPAAVSLTGVELAQGPDDIPRLLLDGREVATFPAGSWPEVCEAFDFGGYRKEQPAAVDGAMVERLAQAVATELYGEPPQPGSNSLTRAMMLPGIKRALTATLAAQQGGTQE